MNEKNIPTTFANEFDRRVEVSGFNKKAIIKNAEGKLSKNHLGKGKVALTLRALVLGLASVWEVAYEKVPLFSEWVAAKKAIIDTEFFNFLSGIMQKFQSKPNFEGMTPEQIYQMGMKVGSDGVVDASKSPLGQFFAALLQFVIEHPTVSILSGATIIAIFGKGLKLLFKRHRNKNNNDENIILDDTGSELSDTRSSKKK